MLRLRRAGSVWQPNYRWVRMEPTGTRSGRSPERVERRTIQPLGKPMSVIAKAIAARQRRWARGSTNWPQKCPKYVVRSPLWCLRHDDLPSPPAGGEGVQPRRGRNSMVGEQNTQDIRELTAWLEADDAKSRAMRVTRLRDLLDILPVPSDGLEGVEQR